MHRAWGGRGLPRPLPLPGSRPSVLTGPSTYRWPRRLPPSVSSPTSLSENHRVYQRITELSQQLRRFRPGSVSWQEGASSLCTWGRGVCEGFGRVTRSGGRQRTGSTEFLNHLAGASQQGKILSPRGPLTMSGRQVRFSQPAGERWLRWHLADRSQRYG